MKTPQNFVSSLPCMARCPCGGEYDAGYADGNPCAIHSLPQCKEFERLGIVDFMVWARQNGARPALKYKA